MTPWLLPLGAALLTAALCRALLHPRFGPRILDAPGARSLHERPTPRTGGLAMMAVLLPAALAAAGLGIALPLDGAALAGWALLVAVSLLDDVRGLRPAVRLPVHVAAAGLLVSGVAPHALTLPGGWVLPLGLLGGPLALLFAVWMLNLYNFMDGMDGFAGGMGAIGFGALALLAQLAGPAHAGYALAAACVAAVNLGFLALNFPPARLFMGDVGAVPMGYLAAAFALAGAAQGLFALWVPALVFSVFIVDATVTLLRRAWRRERVWEAHRSHYYQRTVLAGWSHRRTVLAAYAIMLATAATALGVTLRPAAALEPALEPVAVLAWLAAFALLALAVRRLERNAARRRKAAGAPETAPPQSDRH